MAGKRRPPQPPLRQRPAKQVAPSSRATTSEPPASLPAPKRRKSSRAHAAAAAGPAEASTREAPLSAASINCPTAMDLPAGAPELSKTMSGAESASASNSPSEEAAEPLHGLSRSSGGSEGSQRAVPSPAELGGALGLFLKRTSQLEDSSGSSQFSVMFRDLKSDDSSRQITALTELSEYLSFSSEEALISFPMETFIPVLIGLLENPGHADESAAQVMLLCCRCLFNVVDILPPTARIITAAGGLPVLCAKLLNVEYIDVAELAVAIIEWISEDQPLQVLKAGGLQAILTFLDFFQISAQRQAVNAAALMLLPVPPAEILEQRVRPALPTLAQLLQHTDPQVLQSVCECWRHVLDNTIAVHCRLKDSVHGNIGPSASMGRIMAKGKWRPGEHLNKERGDEAASEAATLPLASALVEMCPSSVLSNLLLLLGNSISSPSANSTTVASEVLYILSVLTNYCDTCTEEVLKQDACSLLRQMLLSTDFSNGHAMSQTNSSLLRILSAVASMLPSIQLVGSVCECEEKRLAMFRDNTKYLDAFAEAFLPLLVDIYEASTDPGIQSLCITLLLTFFLTCRDRPELIQKCLNPTPVACFLANLLLVGTSKSVTLSCLLIVHELLERHSTPYSLLFVRHGVVRAIHRLVTREGEHHRRSMRLGKARSRSHLVDEAAHRVLSSYFASSSHTGESVTLRALGKIAKQLRGSPSAVIEAHREALEHLHELLLASDGITAFELSCSGAAGALSAFLFPQAESAAVPSVEEWGAFYGDRLRLFMECMCKSLDDGALMALVRLSVSAVQRIEQQPLALFPAHASPAAALPPHLRTHISPQHVAPGERGGLGSSSDLPPGFSGRSSNRPHDSGQGTSALLSVLRLLGKPVRVRLSPHGIAGSPISSNFASASGVGPASLPNFRTLLVPFGSSKTVSRNGIEAKGPLPALQAGGSAAAAGAAAAAAATGAAKAAAAAAAAMVTGGSSSVDLSSAAAAAASPATRLRNYFASKVSRKRPTPSAGSAASSSGPAEKRGAATNLLAKLEMKAGRHAPDDAWPAWEVEDDAMRDADFLGGHPPRGPGDGSSSPRDGPPGAAREREREILGEALEAVLLVEPFALVSALEDYIREKHGPKNESGSHQRAPETTQRGSSAAAPASSVEPGRPQESARVRLSVKQPALPGSFRDRPAPPQPEGSSPTAALLDPADAVGSAELQAATEVSSAMSPRTPGTESAPSAPVGAMEPSSGAGSAQVAGSVSTPQPLVEKKQVNIYLSGQPLASKTSVVQALVNGATTNTQTARGKHEDAGRARMRTDRFLACVEEGFGSDVESCGADVATGPQASPRQFCGNIWGRVHAMTYEIAEPGSSTPHEIPNESGTDKLQVVRFVTTDFDSLVENHGRVVAAIAALQSPVAPGIDAYAGTVPEFDEEAGDQMAPRGSTAKALGTLLQLISALQHILQHLNSIEGRGEVVRPSGLDDGTFHCSSLTAMLLRQLSDPLAVCTGSIPGWCTKLAATCRFLFPASVRRILHQSCSLGLSRALHHVQQRALAQHAHSQEAQRRLEGEVAITSIPRQKVRISRQRILESAIKVMSLYGAGSAILEVEYVGEVGTGSGPTLEFYAQVAEILRTSEPRLFREGVPLGMLFPEPWEHGWLQKAEDLAAQQILERFRLLGQVVAKCILDGRLVDIQLHPLFWRSVLCSGPISLRSLREVDPELHTRLESLRQMDNDALVGLCVDFTLPGHPEIELKPNGADLPLSAANVEEYITCVTEVALVKACAPQVAAFRSAFRELLPLEACRIWSEKELASLIMGANVNDDAFWTMEHLSAHIKAQHGYSAESRCFRDLLTFMGEFAAEDRRRFLTFVTGAPSLPVGGFAGLKPPLTVVKKEAPPPPANPDQFMPSVMTCANYLKLPEYSNADILRQKLQLAMVEGQSAFLLS